MTESQKACGKQGDDNTHLEIIDNLDLGGDAAEELARTLDEPLGLIKDHSYDRYWYLVRWPDDE